MTTEDERNFRSLRVGGWRQFGEVSVEFDPRLTVLTGANASGKSTLLTLLARHFEWTRSYSASPRSRKRGSTWTVLDLGAVGASNRVGTLEYSDAHLTSIVAPQQEWGSPVRYDVSYEQPQTVAGLYLTSHRVVAGNYAPVETIPALFGNSEQILQQFTNVVRNHWLHQWGGKSPQQVLKESLIAAALFGEESESVERNPEAREIWTGFRELLGRIFPPSLGYRGLRIREAEVIVETSGGDWTIDEVSGGLSALIEMAWQIFLRSRDRDTFTVLIDEPENHLHPRLQREVMPTFLRAFPNVQFIVATHSPFVVTASPDSVVYVLDYESDNAVFSRRLDYGNHAASADDTLRRVLGLDSTMPIWAEDRFDAILQQFLKQPLSESTIMALRNALKENGLSSEFPTALLGITDELD